MRAAARGPHTLEAAARGSLHGFAEFFRRIPDAPDTPGGSAAPEGRSGSAHRRRIARRRTSHPSVSLRRGHLRYCPPWTGGGSRHPAGGGPPHGARRTPVMCVVREGSWRQWGPPVLMVRYPVRGTTRIRPSPGTSATGTVRPGFRAPAVPNRARASPCPHRPRWPPRRPPRPRRLRHPGRTDRRARPSHPAGRRPRRPVRSSSTRRATAGRNPAGRASARRPPPTRAAAGAVPHPPAARTGAVRPLPNPRRPRAAGSTRSACAVPAPRTPGARRHRPGRCRDRRARTGRTASRRSPPSRTPSVPHRATPGPRAPARTPGTGSRPRRAGSRARRPPHRPGPAPRDRSRDGSPVRSPPRRPVRPRRGAPRSVRVRPPAGRQRRPPGRTSRPCPRRARPDQDSPRRGTAAAR